MIESVNTSVKISPLPNPENQQPLSQDVISGQATKNAESSSNSTLLTTEEPKPDKEVERVSELVDTLQESMDMIKERTNHLLFSVDEQTDQVMVKVTNKESGEVIREIPSQEFLDLAAKFEQMVGLMFDIKI